MSLFANRFLRNIATLQAGGALYSGLNVVASVGLAHVLGASQQGSWLVAVQLYSFAFFLMNLGVLQVVVTQVAAASASGRSAKVEAWLACLIKIYVLLGCSLVAFGALVLPRAVDLWRTINPGIDPRVATWALCLCATPLLDIPRVTVIAALQGTRRMVRLAQVENAGEALRAFLVVAGAILTGSPWGPVVGTLTASTLSALVAVSVYRRANKETDSYPLPSVRRILASIRGVPIREAFRRGLQFGIVRQTDALGKKILPLLVLQTFASSRWVAYFRIAQAFMDLPLMFMQGVSRSALPALAELKGIREHDRFRRAFGRTTWIGGSVVAAGVLVCLPLVPVAVRVMPPDYHGPVWMLCCILLLSVIPVAYTITLDSFYILTNQLRVAVLINVIGFAVGLLATVYLGWRFPPTGAVWGMAVTTSASFAHLAFVHWYFRHGDGRGAARGATA